MDAVDFIKFLAHTAFNVFTQVRFKFISIKNEEVRSLVL